MLDMEASTEMTSPQGNSTKVNDSKIIEVDLTADTPSESPEVGIVAGRSRDRKSLLWRNSPQKTPGRTG